MGYKERETGAPTRCPINPLVCYAVEGFIEGLEDAGFPMEILPANFSRELKLTDYEMPERVWHEINQWACDQQAKVILSIIRRVHLNRAVYRLEMARTAPKTLEDQLYRLLPLELTGRRYVLETTDELKPLLSRFGLDKGVIWGKTGKAEYPSVEHLFCKTRAQFFRVYGLETYEGLYNFLRQMPSRLPDWPEELATLFRDETVVMDTINQIATHY